MGWLKIYTKNQFRIRLWYQNQDLEYKRSIRNHVQGKKTKRLVSVNYFSKFDKEQEPQECYGTYDPEHESKEPLKGISGTAGQYTELGGVFLGRDYWGKTTPWVEHYNAGGYVTYLPKNDFQKASKKIEQLKTDEWLDNGTRLLVIGMFFIRIIRYYLV